MPALPCAHALPQYKPTRSPTQPHSLLVPPAGRELDSFCLEMTHWASREKLQLGTDPEGWRTADVPACGAECSHRRLALLPVST